MKIAAWDKIVQIEFNENREGFYATFENGWVMSVQWNLRNYVSSNTVEIAAWDEDEDVWWDFVRRTPVDPYSSVTGWVTSDKLGEYMDDIASITMGSAELQLMVQRSRDIDSIIEWMEA